MALWMTAFKAIPWTEVIAAAPAVVDGARKLLRKVRKREAPEAGEGELPEWSDAPADEQLARLGAEVQALQARLAEMHEEQLASSDLLQSMAEQNETLVTALGILRLRVKVLLWVSAALALGLAGHLVWHL